MKKFFKTFLKMKYNRLLLFIYKKEFRRLYRHRAIVHSAQEGPQQAPIMQREQAPVRVKTKKEEPPKKEKRKK